ncbi:MAG: inorganic phosphate transporter [Methanobacteriota archaeon]
MLEGLSTTVILIILIALFFDFVNGWNDAANSVATVVSTKVLTPIKAVALAAFMNFVAFFIMPHAVALTIGKGIVDISIVTPTLILSTLLAAIFWGVVMTQFGLPISMSHTLIGGFMGAGIAAGGFQVLIMSGITKVLVFIVLAPIFGFVFSMLFSAVLFRAIRKLRPSIINRIFGKLQLLSVSWYSLGHGANDALKTAGIISALLISVGYMDISADIPAWVILSAYVSIGLGTLIGGWKVIRTMGMKITKLRPVDGFSAETGGGVLLFLTSIFGIPVSTTHVIAGSIMGVGATKRATSVRWGLARTIVGAWILTIPATTFGGFVVYKAFVLLNITL